MEICIDFDGTCVTHAYPEIGKDIGAVPVLERIISEGHKIILFTMRSGKELQEAVNWFLENEITTFGININPSQIRWTSSPKAYGQLYIDDAALGCPLIKNLEVSSRPYVDWEKVECWLEENKILTKIKIEES